jgi:hypothetical protein
MIRREYDMLTFLFWNMGGELPERTPTQLVLDRQARMRRVVGNLLQMNGVDVLAVAECPIGHGELLREINQADPDAFDVPDPM